MHIKCDQIQLQLYLNENYSLKYFYYVTRNTENKLTFSLKSKKRLQ